MKYYRLEILIDGELQSLVFTKSKDYKKEIKELIKKMGLNKDKVEVFVGIVEKIKI